MTDREFHLKPSQQQNHCQHSIYTLQQPVKISQGSESQLAYSTPTSFTRNAEITVISSIASRNITNSQQPQRLLSNPKTGVNLKRRSQDEPIRTQNQNTKTITTQ
ncbi:hypothetical protein M758_8G075900 [Ceratodon purpureus]|nr:hypothetical protein M758_8G075900 [Ceratodon purpureus]